MNLPSTKRENMKKQRHANNAVTTNQEKMLLSLVEFTTI